MTLMKWYDVIAPVYDRSIERTYLPYRQMAVQTLHLRPGEIVLDIGCGTGLNFELILNLIGTQGTLMGIDSSVKMLERARKKVEQHGWSNIHLLQRDARNLIRSDFEYLTGSRILFDSIICTLGFSVFPDWQEVFERSFDLLENGGRYCIMDIYNDKDTLRVQMIRFLAKADNSRRVWEPLKRCDDYNEERFPMSHSDTVVIASGTKA